MSKKPGYDSSRRRFINQFGAAAGAVAFGRPGEPPLAAQGPGPGPGIPDPDPSSPFPALNRRTLGWLKFLWEKATTADDWSAAGVPHMWWDRYTAPVVLSYGRFDLAYSTYALILMADQTPAWREAYTRIADLLVGRYPTYWGAIDWLTQIGDDPKRANYPPAVMNQIPPALRGSYNRYGWTGNGLEPWGLQPDPIGADGNLFYRGWFTLMLSIHRYISGDDKWARPFKVTGYHDETFEWDQHRIAERLESQYRAHSEGPHCENTKIWFFCNTAAGLGLYLYDRLYGKQTHRAFQNFLEYARENYVGVGRNGKLEWVTSYYDPIAGNKQNGGPAGGASTAFLLLPQDRAFAASLYEAAANAAGWNDPNAPARASSAGLLLARELGDQTSLERLREAAEREFEPRVFGDQQDKFGWWFHLNEGYPRGQQSAMMMVSEVGNGGDWMRAFDAPHLDKFTAPTVEGIDFPALGVSQAWNDPATGVLHVRTYAATPDRRGAQTSWRLTHLPNASTVAMRLDGQPFTRFEVTGPNSIRIDTTIDLRRYEIVTGYRGSVVPGIAEHLPPAAPVAAASLAGSSTAPTSRTARASSRPVLSPAGGGGCCCPG